MNLQLSLMNDIFIIIFIGLFLASCAGNKPCPGVSGLAGGLTDQQGRSYGGTLEWSVDGGGVGGGQCMVFITSDSRTSAIRLTTAYHCLRNLVLNRLSLEDPHRQLLELHLDVDRSATNSQCTHERLSVNFDLAASHYLVKLQEKFTTLAQRENLVLPLTESDYQQLKETDQVWLEPFTHTGSHKVERYRPSGQEPSLRERDVCSARPEASGSAHQLIGAGAGRALALKGACYSFTDLAHIDVTVDAAIWQENPTCLTGLAAGSIKLAPVQIPAAPGSETWEEVRQSWQLGILDQSNAAEKVRAQEMVVTQLEKFHSSGTPPVHKRYEGNVIKDFFNHGIPGHQRAVSFSTAQNLSIWTRFSNTGSNPADFSFKELTLAWQGDLRVDHGNRDELNQAIKQTLTRPVDATSHIYAIAQQYWGLTVLYDPETYAVYPGSSGSILTTKGGDEISEETHVGVMIGSLYSVDNHEFTRAAAPSGHAYSYNNLQPPEEEEEQLDKDKVGTTTLEQGLPASDRETSQSRNRGEKLTRATLTPEEEKALRNRKPVTFGLTVINDAYRYSNAGADAQTRRDNAIANCPPE